MTPGTRALRPVELFALAFGTIAGIAWLFLTGPWLRAAGPIGSAIGLVGGGALMIPIVWCYAHASQLYPGGGGELLYVGHTLGRWVGLLAGWLLALAYIALVAFHVVTVSWLAQICLTRSAQMGATPSPPAVLGIVVSLGIFSVIVYGNVRGAAAASKLQDAIVVLLALATLGLAANAMRLGHTAYLTPYFGSSQSVSAGILQIIATAPFLYGGFNTAVQAANELKERHLGQMMLILSSAVLAAALFYSTILLSMACVLPRPQLLSYEMPALDAFQAGMHSPSATLIVGLIALVALCTSWNGVFLGAWKLIVALCRARLLPGASTSREEPPIRFAVALVTLTSLLLSLRGRSGLLGIVAAVAVIMALVFCMMSAGILRTLVKHPIASPQSSKRSLGIASLAVGISLGIVWLSIDNLFHTPTSRGDAVLLGAGALMFVALALGRRRHVPELRILQSP